MSTKARKGPGARPRVRPAARRPSRPHRPTRRRLVTYAVPAALALAAAVITLSTGGGGGSPSPAGSVRVSGPARSDLLPVGAAVPDFSAPGLDGPRVSWADYRGEPTVLVVWAPWCPHCQEELPVFGRVAVEFPSVKVVTVVSFIGDAPGPSAEEVLEENGLSFPTAVDDADETLARALGATGTPTTYFVGPDGTIRLAVSGEMGEEAMRGAFQTLAQVP